MTSTEQQQPKPLKRKHIEHSDELHACIVRMREHHFSWALIEALAAVPKSTAQTIVAVAAAEGRTAKKHKGGAHHQLLDACLVKLMCDLQASDNTLRLSDIHDFLDLVMPSAPPSLATIWRVLERAGFTTKQLQLYAAPRNSPETKEKRKEWVLQVAPTLSAATTLFIDESPFSFCITRGRGRSMKGTPAITVTPAIRGRNHTVIAAISPLHGLVYFEIKTTAPDEEFISKRKGSKKKKTGPKGVNRDVFRSFLIHLFEQPLFADSSTAFQLVLDNAQIHKGDIEETVFQKGYEYVPLPPWSPALNAIEYAFSKWKFAYRVRHSESEEAVDEAIKQAAKTLTPADCMKWFEHTKSLYAKCKDLEDL